MVTPPEVLYIIELIYFTPALPFAVYLTIKHGFGRQAGWILLIILSLVRIIGACTGIAAVYQPSTSLIETSLILSSVGSTILVATFSALINRVNNNTGRSPVPPRLSRLVQLAALVAIILLIYGGTQYASGDPSTVSSGYNYQKAALFIILAQLIFSTVLAGFCFVNSSYIKAGERKLLIGAVAALPFVLVRLIYALIAVFDHTSSNWSLFSSTTGSVVLRGILQVAMEIVAMSIFIVTGFLVPKEDKRQPFTEEATPMQYQTRS